MKSLFLTFLVLIAATFNLSSQSHYILAGQTNGMTFTSVQPYLYLHGHWPYYSITMNVDIENDGQPDIQLVYYANRGGPVSYTFDDQVHSMNSAVQILSARDSFTSSCSGWFTVTVGFQNSDTIWNGINFSTSAEQNYSNAAGPNYYCGYGSVGHGGTYFYLAGRRVIGIDTALFYIHFANLSDSIHDGLYLLDYAIEGPDTTIIINSIHELSSSEKISVFPNPFTNQINITSQRPFEFVMSDYLGRIVLSGKSDGIIRTDELAAGTYILTIRNEETFSVKKMVKVE